ncbi:MAG TPA: ABC transporter ATP-binding protein, partial [Salinimicrobium sp.]|nr:ABC transporter ATP-binding protein [Salinimicrobium sp.]
MAVNSGNAFDFSLFKRLLEYTRAYKATFYFVAIAAILLSVFAILRPYLIQVTIDDSIVPQDNDNLVLLISLMAGVLLLEVIF